MNNRPIRDRIRSGLPYALFILAGLACIVLIALSAVGRQGLGWLIGAQLGSQLDVDYNLQITATLPAVDPTRIAELLATDVAALNITPDPNIVVTVPAGQITPGSTVIARVTLTPTPSNTPPPTFTPTPSNTPTRTPTPSRTPTPRPTFTLTSSPRPPNTATNTQTPPPPNTNTPTSPASTNTPTSPASTNTPTVTLTPSPSATVTPSPSATTNPAPPAPASVVVANTGTTLVSLAWSDESRADSDFVQYRVYNSTASGGPYVPVGATTGTSFVVSGLTTGQPYFFIVRGEDTLQSSVDSPEASGTPSAIAAPNPTPPPSCPAPAPPDCSEAGGPPNGTPSTVDPGEVLTLDLGAGNGILDGPGYDLVYYEIEIVPAPSYRAVQMDWVTVELSLDATTWYVAFAWSLGNESLAPNSNIAPYAVSGGLNPDAGYCDLLPGAAGNELVPMLPNGEGFCPSWTSGLWGALNTGVAIDIGGVIPAPLGEGYRYIRIQARPDALQPAQIDGIERLN
ncbi:MAG TPA: hypothetical protein VJG32_18920 [Anaerolineae bacterium]|nr:hypothetical protein [Anaerolineae bacterium]